MYFFVCSLFGIKYVKYYFIYSTQFCFFLNFQYQCMQEKNRTVLILSEIANFGCLGGCCYFHQHFYDICASAKKTLLILYMKT